MGNTQPKTYGIDLTYNPLLYHLIRILEYESLVELILVSKAVRSGFKRLLSNDDLWRTKVEYEGSNLKLRWSKAYYFTHMVSRSNIFNKNGDIILDLNYLIFVYISKRRYNCLSADDIQKIFQAACREGNLEIVNLMLRHELNVA